MMRNKILQYFIEGKTAGDKYGDFVIQNGKMLFNRVGGLGAKYQDNTWAPEKRGIWAFPYPLFESFFISGPFSMPSQHSPKKSKIVKIDSKLRNQLEKRLRGLKTKMEIGISKLKSTEDNPFPKYFGHEKYEIEDLEKALKDGEIDSIKLSSSMKHKYKPTNKIRRFYWGGPIWARFAPKGEEVTENGWYKYDDIYSYIKELRKYLFEWRRDSLYGSKDNKGILYKIGVPIASKDANMSMDHLEVFLPMSGNRD